MAGATPFKLGIIKYKKKIVPTFDYFFIVLKLIPDEDFKTSSHIYFYKGVHASFSLVILEINICSDLLNLQSVHAPNGLIAHLFGPIEGRRHDAFMLGESGLNHILQRFWKPDEEPYIIYGDPAHGITRNILAPFRGACLTADQQEFTSQMSKVRCSVEWGFGNQLQNTMLLEYYWQIVIHAYMGPPQAPFSTWIPPH